jgi:hypothetical protein
MNTDLTAVSETHLSGEVLMIIRTRRQTIIMLVAIPLLLLAPGVSAEQNKASRQEGEYRIMFSGREIGVEKYVLVTTADGVSSSSTLNLNNPGAGPKKLALETKLEADGQCVPRNYELKSDVDGEKGTIRGSFAPNQVIFDYTGKGASYRSGLLVGNRYTILDTNIFHHFIFLARIFKYDSGKTPQVFEVVIPQEKDTGTLRITPLNKESITVKGKKVNASHLLVDSGSLQIHLWVDGERIPRKIAVPDKKIEVLHGN